MRASGTPSWRLSIDRWAAVPTIALWFRAVERIPVSAGGAVPSNLVIEPFPASSVPQVDPDEAAEGWLHWWEQVLDRPFVDPSELARWPDLNRVTVARWREATRWHSERKRMALSDAQETRLLEVEVVQGLEREQGRSAPPFALDLWVLAVHDAEVRRIGDDRWIVAERVYLGPEWPARLRGLIRPYWD